MLIVSIKSRVQSVQVFHRGAIVTRVATLQRDSGVPAKLRLSGLPMSLLDDSVRVSLAGAPRPPTVHDVSVVLDVPDRDDTLLPPASDELLAARRTLRQLERAIEATEEELGMLVSLQLVSRPKGSEGEPPIATPAAARLALVEFREAQRKTLHKQLAALEKKNVTADRELAILEDKNSRASSARQVNEHELRKAIVISLADLDRAATSIEVTLQYEVPGARWAPAYTLRLERNMDHATLEMRALVGQHSGEDWTDARLTLSTAEMQKWAELPELKSIRIGRQQTHQSKPGWRPPPAGTDELYGDWDRDADHRKTGHRESEFAKQSDPVAGRLDEFDASIEEVVLPQHDGAFAASGAEKIGEEFDDVLGEEFDELSEVSAQFVPEPAPMRSKAAPSGRQRKGKNKKGSNRRAPPSSHLLGGATTAESFGRGESRVMSEDVSDDLLRYGELSMPDASSPQRGRLTVTNKLQVYLEVLVQQNITVSGNVMATLATASRRAELKDHKLPGGHRFAWSERYDYAYNVHASVDIPSDGNFHNIPVVSAAGRARATFVATPRESCDVFRTVKFDNPLGAPLLPGPVDVYVGGDFLLTSQTDFVNRTDAVELGLGVEQKIKVARNTKFREESVGLMSGSLQLHHHIDIDVSNNLDREIELEVRERLPEVRDDDKDDIQLNVHKVNPKWEAYKQEPPTPDDQRLDAYRWHIKVPAGGSEAAHVNYIVKIAAKHELVGGNRRES